MSEEGEHLRQRLVAGMIGTWTHPAKLHFARLLMDLRVITFADFLQVLLDDGEAERRRLQTDLARIAAIDDLNI